MSQTPQPKEPIQPDLPPGNGNGDGGGNGDGPPPVTTCPACQSIADDLNSIQSEITDLQMQLRGASDSEKVDLLRQIRDDGRQLAVTQHALNKCEQENGCLPSPPTPNPIPPGTYQVILAYFFVAHTRASDDTLYIGAAGQTDAQAAVGRLAQWQQSFFEEIEDASGRHDLNLDVGTFSVPPGAELRLCHIFLNYGGDAQTFALGTVVDEAIRKIGPREFDQPLNLKQVGDELSAEIGNTGGCDGAVAAYNYKVTGDQLEQATQFGVTTFVLQREEQGYDSIVGCGVNSDYSVTWQISRTLNPPT